MSGLCALVAGGLVMLSPAPSFQLVWTHSVEKVEWREDWRVLDGGRLWLERASVAGSGAGMEPSPEARWVEGRWVWSPARTMEEVSLALSGFTADWRLCAEGVCRPLAQLLPGRTEARLRACP